MNIITRGTGNKAGGSFKQEIGSFGKIRSSLGYNSGKLNNGCLLYTSPSPRDP